MAQNYFKLNGVQVKTPDEYEANLSTTSTSDSGRNQYLTMKNTPIGTVQSYSITWKNLTLAEASAILQQVLDKPSFTAYYCNIYTGGWTTGSFYATTFNSPAKTLKDGVEIWDELSFNIISIDAI